MNRKQISAFYKFFPIDSERLDAVRQSLLEAAASCEIVGLLIVATEGCNGTFAGDPENVAEFQRTLGRIFYDAAMLAESLEFKESFADKEPFADFRVKVRPEIVTIKSTELRPSGKIDESHLNAEGWERMLTQSEDVVLLDTRNWYEVELGTFRGAEHLNIQHFSEFGEALQERNIPKDKTVLTFCTGGIRCEKAVLEMKRQGYNDVRQLEGGILKYLEQYPGRAFEGECFVFDARVSVTQELEPSTRYAFCPHCGQPASEQISCEICDESAKVCERCLVAQDRHTCSHNCRYHYNRLNTPVSSVA